MTDLSQNLRGLILSASELRELHPEWSGAMIEDYLSLFENIVLLAEGIGNSMALVPGAEEGNIPVFDGAGQVEDSGQSISDIEINSFFLAQEF